MMNASRRDGLVKLGAVLTASGASLCCLLPAAVAFLGVGSAAMGAGMARFRPIFLILTAVLVGFAFYRAYRTAPGDCGPGEACAVPAGVRRRRRAVWILAVVSLVLSTVPYYINWIL